MLMLPVPSNEAEPTWSPLIAIVRAVSRAVAVAALPEVFAVMLSAIVVVIEIPAEPSKLAVPDTAPATAIALVVASLVASAANVAFAAVPDVS